MTKLTVAFRKFANAPKKPITPMPPAIPQSTVPVLLEGFPVCGKSSLLGSPRFLLTLFDWAPLLTIVLWTLPQKYPSRKQSHPDKSGDPAGHGASPWREMTCCGNLSHHIHWFRCRLVVWIIGYGDQIHNDVTTVLGSCLNFYLTMGCFCPNNTFIFLIAITACDPKADQPTP